EVEGVAKGGRPPRGHRHSPPPPAPLDQLDGAVPLAASLSLDLRVRCRETEDVDGIGRASERGRCPHDLVRGKSRGVREDPPDEPSAVPRPVPAPAAWTRGGGGPHPSP